MKADELTASGLIRKVEKIVKLSGLGGADTRSIVREIYGDKAVVNHRAIADIAWACEASAQVYRKKFNWISIFNLGALETQKLIKENTELLKAQGGYAS